MLSSTAGEYTGFNSNNNSITIYNTTINTLSSSSSLSHQHKSKTMEEVWKDIASFNNNPSSSDPSSSSHKKNPNFILQDFFAESSRIVSSSTTGVNTPYTNLFGACISIPPPTTALSLNSSTPYFDAFFNKPNVTSFNSSGDQSFSKKRVQDSDSSSPDRHHKRMMKNREAAARSRARRQAYTNELEIEIGQLKEENERLKQEQESYLAATALLPKKYTLQRTSTAPF